MGEPGKTSSGLPAHGAQSTGVGPHRVAALRAAYLAGHLVAYLKALRAATVAGGIAPPDVRSRPRRAQYRAAAMIRALRDARRDNALYENRRSKKAA